MEHIDGSGLMARVSYDLSRRVTAGVSYSYDDGYESRVSGDIRIALGSKGGSKGNDADGNFIFASLSKSLENRDVRVHDKESCVEFGNWVISADICDDMVQDWCDENNAGHVHSVTYYKGDCSGCCQK